MVGADPPSPPVSKPAPAPRAGLLAIALTAALLTAGVAGLSGQRGADESDREAFRAWFVLLADTQFYRPTTDVADCAGLVRHAVREALRPHTTEWLRQLGIGAVPNLPDVRHPPAPGPDGWPLFLVGPGRRAEFADARTIVSLNTVPLGRNLDTLRPGDLLYFRQPAGESPDHLMVFVGPSYFDRTARDWIVYHTGPDGSWAGEVRKVRLSDLLRHPAHRWRPVRANRAFVGLFRLTLP
jgi:uncharacterized protein YfaT (DUF1175 family)